MSAYSLPAFLAFAINVSLAAIILLDNLKSRPHRLFAVLVFCFVLWDVGDIMILNSAGPDFALAGSVVLIAALLFAPAIFLLLSFSFPHSIDSRFDRWPLRPVFLCPPLAFTFFAGTRLFQPLVVFRSADLDVYSFMANEWTTPLTAGMYASVLAYLGWGTLNYATQLRKARSRKDRMQIMYILSGALSFAVLIILLDALQNHQYLSFGASHGLTLLISIFFAYAVLGNRLFTLRRIGRQALAYALTTGVVFGFYLIVIKNITGMLARQFNITSHVIDALVILILAISFRPLVVRVQSLIDHLFYENIFRYRKSFVHFSRDIYRLTGISELISAVVAFLEESLFASSADVMLKDESSQIFRSVLDPRKAESLDEDLQDHLMRQPKACETVELSSICSGTQRAMFDRYAGGYVVPLLAEKGMTGILLVGPSVSGRPYTLDEAEFLTSFANGVSIAVERNLLVERMRNEEIRTGKIEKLAALGRLTAGIAHEFRNPLNIVSTAAQTILRNPDDAALHRETGMYILEETDRLKRTVDEFLQFAKPHTPVWERAGVTDVIAGAMDALRASATAHGVRLRTRTDPSIPELTTSRQHLERVLVNLGLNAIEAMPQGGELTVAADLKGNRTAVISVQDTGPGIPPENRARLFDPFFTTKPAGTGLGLAIVYMLIQSLKGTITYTSDSTGTTFLVELPLDGSR